LRAERPAPPALQLAAGLTAGFLSGLLGIGGGLVVGPFLALRGLELPRALGTALVVVAPIACVGVLTELAVAPANLHLLPALGLAVGGQLGAPLGARILNGLPDRALRLLFAGVLVLTALRNLGLVGGPAPAGALPGLGGAPGLDLAVAGALGVLAGLASTLFGIGGGLVAVPGLVYAVGGIPFPEAAATSLLAMIPTVLRGVWIARREGRIVPGAARWLLPAALLAAAAAVLLRNEVLAPVLLARLFGLFLLYAGWRILSRPPQKPSSRTRTTPPDR